MPSPADWISLAEASEVLARGERPLPPRDDRRLGAGRPPPEHQARRSPVRPPRRDPGADRRAPAGPGRGRPAGPLRRPRATDRPAGPAPPMTIAPPAAWRRSSRPLRRQPRVVTAEAVFDAYGSAGGGLLAGGLAYSGLLASLSACLLIVGLIGFLVRDPVRQAALVEELALRLPPLAELLRTGLDRVADRGRRVLDRRPARPGVGDRPLLRRPRYRVRAGLLRRAPARSRRPGWSAALRWPGILVGGHRRVGGAGHGHRARGLDPAAGRAARS